MKKKHLWLIIASLFVLNIIFILLLTIRPAVLFAGSRETVAEVGKDKITREEWLNEMEQRYGKEVLNDLIDQKVIGAMAEKYDVEVSKDAVERELTLVKTMYQGNRLQQLDESKWKEQIKYSLLLEELLTRDVVVTEEEMKDYYDQNKSLFQVPDSYHISQIVVKTKKEAEQTIKELENGSSFPVLAMERSIDEFTANQGGETGFISEEDERFSQDFIDEAAKLKEGEWSEPVEVEDGYAVILLHEHLEGRNYAFKDVKNQIRRQVALEQMDTPASAKPFWNEIKVDSFYDKQEEKQ
ncbi:peptidyl-prolyl cis-trans isomerase [Bacillus infantis]|uniref:peptidylprolyl isomerase n=1 Tax=Bacillus infantis TaxID=324767 RepID=A0A5D4QQK8_9BACI|nr:peptidyl-prolyl cis-trans isomerase [Bacillus infantis]TYS41287.1 peptidylprolyl isomerase [Bacillus infantis]